MFVLHGVCDVSISYHGSWSESWKSRGAKMWDWYSAWPTRPQIRDLWVWTLTQVSGWGTCRLSGCSGMSPVHHPVLEAGPGGQVLTLHLLLRVEFVKMASECDAVNLGQGFPDFPPPDFAVEAFQHALSSDFMLNQYTRAFGYPPLTKILASFFGKLLGQEIDPFKNVLVTVGAYGALFTAFQALVEEGDEVIIIEPFFDCYEPMTLMAGGHPVFVTLKPGLTRDGELDSSSNWQLDPTELASKFTSHTKALILNTPNNPVGKVFSKAELELVASLCQQHDVICIADEVYQWLVYDGYQHVSIASLPGMWERTLTIGSAGKTFSATGWKVGWVLGPDSLMKHLRTVHQNSIYHCPTQGQAAVAQSFEHEQLHFGQASSYFARFPQAMQRTRDHMIRSLQSVGLKPVVSQGSYFFMADISDFKSKMPDLPGDVDEPYDRRFVKWMIKTKGLVAIPVSTFYSVPHRKIFDHYIRFCFVKVRDGVFEGKEGPLKLPAAHWWCGERGWTDLCWCRMSPHSRPWMRNCRNGRRSSGPDTACSALPHLVPAGSAFVRVSAIPRSGVWSGGGAFSGTQDVPRAEPSFLILVDSGALYYSAYIPVLVVRCT
uniref:Kynurenine--oxoglutarate transaminase 1 n=1 Tax=Panthera leo TaxID=9689 RepID=A0A8C8XFK5_PANLE